MAGALFLTRPATTPGPLLRDFESYYAAGAAWLEHADPYSAEVWSTEARVPGVVAKHYELLPYVGPPMTLPLWAAFSRLRFQTAALLWAGLLLLAALAAVAATAVLVHKRDRWSVISLLLLAIAFGPLTSDVALGQVAIVAFAAVLLTTLLLRSRYGWSAAATAVVAAMQPNIALVLVSALRNRRTIITLAVGLVIFVAYSLQTSGGMRGFLQYFAMLRDHLAAERYAMIQLTPTAIAYGFGLREDVAAAIGTSIAGGALMCCCYFFVARAYDGTAKLALICALLPFVVPFFHEHDLIVAFFPAALCMFCTAGPLRIAASVAIVLVAVDWLGIAQRPTGTLQTALLALSVLCALAMCAPRQVPLRQAQGDSDVQGDNNNSVILSLSKERLLPFLVIPVIVICGMVAMHHPAPVWPDAMRSLPSGVENLPAAKAWHVELVRSDLIRVDTFSALLRSFSLLGCALLVFVCAKTCRAQTNN